MRRAAFLFSVVFVHNVKGGSRPRDRPQLLANVGVNFSVCRNLQINQDSRKEGKRKRETAAPSRAEEANSSLADNATSQELASVMIYSDQPTSTKLLHFLSSEPESSPDI